MSRIARAAGRGRTPRFAARARGVAAPRSGRSPSAARRFGARTRAAAALVVVLGATPGAVEFGARATMVSPAIAQTLPGDPAQEMRVTVARVHYGGGGDWYSDPSSLPNWLAEFERRTGIPTRHDPPVVTLTDVNLRAWPFLYMTGHGTIRLTPDEIQALRAYLEDGGFLYADDNYGMDASFRAMVRELFPERSLERVPNSDPIYHCFYDLPGLPKIHEHDGKPPEGLGIRIDGRLVLFYSYESDIGDGLEDPQVHGDPPAKREAAMRMAVNVLMYAITRNVLVDEPRPEGDDAAERDAATS